MKRSRLTCWELVVLTIASLAVCTPSAFAELKPGTTLDKSNCNDAKGLLPDRVLQGYCNGEYGPTEIIEVPDANFQYSEKFRKGSEANAGKYYVSNDGYLHGMRSWGGQRLKQ